MPGPFGTKLLGAVPGTDAYALLVGLNIGPTLIAAGVMLQLTRGW